MNTKFFSLLLSLLFCCAVAHAQEAQKSALQQRAEADNEKGDIASARFHFIRAFEDYAGKGQIRQGVECGTKATALYYKENYYKEAFDLLQRIEQAIQSKEQDGSKKAALKYLTVKERLEMYIRMRRSANALDQINAMETLANATGDESVKNDLLYNKAIYYYTFGQNAQGNAVFKEMADKLTASKEYDKVDQVYQTLIANGRKAGNANLVAQSYSSYLAWKDSANALKHADEIGALKKQIADNEAAISEKDSSLTSRQLIIIGLCILAAALAAALAIGAVVLLRFIALTRKQKKTIRQANENNALKAKFISNISAQLDPTLQKLDSRAPEVKALMDFSKHIQTLSELENTAGEVELEETQVQPFCESLADKVRDKVKSGVTLTVNAPSMSAMINQDYVSHILLHLLNNAAEYTPEGGKIWLDYKKRGAHVHQFLVSDTGQGIPEEKREEIFKPFREIRDLTTGDGLGLPICKQMAINMNGDLDIDPEFTKGTRFVLNLHT
ncbi:Histidine kinase-, DNA gyrase B-, and HSP90-like ATPase [Prevotella aff. ruminicola Tc2-24]|uniref:histidine kinase n=1 Tax=Prevotella aff. ruminicola Tc2-24 TaxID=81582 RepID=A0A1I0PQM4_9BACT|nr:ATP-binding protein [Prevotella aff. ruminicola Tc2-24]SEW16138.1 Histidine kinase-, DNA gyrase B-, and HSP90-like ATPase [Prevotella aff. ruminicola Tc2-24]